MIVACFLFLQQNLFPDKEIALKCVKNPQICQLNIWVGKRWWELQNSRIFQLHRIGSGSYPKRYAKIGKTAGLKGFEPLTYGLRVRRSSELSYKPVI